MRRAFVLLLGTFGGGMGSIEAPILPAPVGAFVDRPDTPPHQRGAGGRSAGARASVAEPLPVVIAHRGASGHAPEHTFAAYDLALAQGADYIEQDVVMTVDGVLVCLHDETLDRTARGASENCSGPVAEKTLAQVQTCDVGSWFNVEHPELAKPEYVGLTIPTLDQVLSRYGSTARYYIEMKPVGAIQPVESEVVRLLNEHGLRDAAVTDRAVLLQSFSSRSLQRVRALDPDLPLIQLLDAVDDASLRAAASLAIGIGPNHGLVDRGLVERAHELGLAVHPWTLESPDHLERLTAACIDGAFTNHPDRYRALLAGVERDCSSTLR